MADNKTTQLSPLCRQVLNEHQPRSRWLYDRRTKEGKAQLWLREKGYLKDQGTGRLELTEAGRKALETTNVE